VERAFDDLTPEQIVLLEEDADRRAVEWGEALERVEERRSVRVTGLAPWGRPLERLPRTTASYVGISAVTVRRLQRLRPTRRAARHRGSGPRRRACATRGSPRQQDSDPELAPPARGRS
jgi:hypothetical protein